MQTRDNGKQAAEEKRDLDLENIAGNLFMFVLSPVVGFAVWLTGGYC
jgi:hypothetical protein